MSLITKLNTDIIIEIINYLVDVDIAKLDTSLTNKLDKNQIMDIYPMIWLNNHKIYDKLNNELLIRDASTKINIMENNVQIHLMISNTYNNFINDVLINDADAEINILEINNHEHYLKTHNSKICHWLISKNINFNNLQILFYISNKLFNYIKTNPNMINTITYFSLNVYTEKSIKLYHLINACYSVQYLNICNTEYKLFEKLDNNLNLISIILDNCSEEIHLNLNKFINLKIISITSCHNLESIDFKSCLKLNYLKFYSCSGLMSLNLNHYELNSLLILSCNNLNLIDISLCPNLTNLSLSCNYNTTIINSTDLTKLLNLMLCNDINYNYKMINNLLFYASNLLILQIMCTDALYNLEIIKNLTNLQLLVLDNNYLGSEIVHVIIKNCSKLKKILFIDQILFNKDTCVGLIDINYNIIVNPAYLKSNQFNINVYLNTLYIIFMYNDHTLFICNNE